MSNLERSKTLFQHFLLFLCLVCTQCPHIFATQKQNWWDANTETTHEQLLHSVSTIQECWIIEEKWRFAKSIRHSKRSNKKVGWRCASYKKSIQVVSQHGIKGPDTMANLVWATTNISGHVMHKGEATRTRSKPLPSVQVSLFYCLTAFRPERTAAFRAVLTATNWPQRLQREKQCEVGKCHQKSRRSLKCWGVVRGTSRFTVAFVID